MIPTSFHSILFSKIPSSFKPPTKPPSASHLPISSSISHPPRRPPNPPTLNHQPLLVEAFNHNDSLRALIWDISREDSTPLQLLDRDGDWTDEMLWAAIRLLIGSERVKEALQVFDFWKGKDISRINAFNYSKIIQLLCDGGFLEEAVSTFQDMDKYSLSPSLAVYNGIIHGFAQKKQFDLSEATFKKMIVSGIMPTRQTYNGLIQAYGIYGMYDEIGKCLKRMEFNGCIPDEITYNILIGEFARGGLLERMEREYRTLRSKRMNLQSATLIMMLEAYADLGVLDKMEKFYLKVLKSKAFIKENLIRKLAMVYIKNYKFSRLEDLVHEMASRTGKTDLLWCILLLSCACLLSRKGVESVTREMEVAKVSLNITSTNILALFYVKVKYFRGLDDLFSRAWTYNVKPDMATFGILFDACEIGYDGTRVLEVWRRRGFLEAAVEMRTDPLVLTAFGKGFFIKKCETMFHCLDSEAKQKSLWTFGDLISLAFGEKKCLIQKNHGPVTRDLTCGTINHRRPD